MSLKRTENPFLFATQVNLVELTGQKARDLNELLEILKKSSPSIIFHHTHHFLKQHQFLSPEPPNDFAYWVTNVLQEDKLGERLAAVDTIRFPSVRALGAKIIEVIEQYLSTRKTSRTAPDGEEFHVMKSKSFVLPTHYRAHDLAEFLEAIRKVSIHSLYHHIFSARIRLGREANDFSLWLENELAESALAKSISMLDPYTQTLEGLRNRIIHLIEKRLHALEKESAHATR